MTLIHIDFDHVDSISEFLNYLDDIHDIFNETFGFRVLKNLNDEDTNSQKKKKKKMKE